MALSAQSGLAGCSFVMEHAGRRAQAQLSIPGPFWVDNALAAVLAVSLMLEMDPLDVVPLLPRLSCVKGRMEKVDLGQPFSVVVDYAHTPGAFEKLMPWVRSHTERRIIAVFGSAGERDVQKRPMQGAVASRYCDTLVLTEEDPRGEDSLAILEQIATGCGTKARGETLHLVPDRVEAIRKAFSLAGAGDTVLLLGKGHEGSIIGKNGPREYDERTQAEGVLREMGFGGRQGESA